MKRGDDKLYIQVRKRGSLDQTFWWMHNLDVFSYEVWDGAYLRVVLWYDRKKYDQSKRRADSHAFYQQSRFKFFERDGEWATNQKTFGVIHLVDGDFTVGHFAHELQHFIMVWAEWMQMDEDKACEYYPTLVQNITDDFFRWWEEGKEHRWIWTPLNENAS